jgi:hypothetical protein
LVKSTSKSHLTHPLSDNRIAIHLVDSNFENIILVINIIGTDKNIQTIHHRLPQKTKEIRVTSGLKFNLFQVRIGSIKLHTIIFILINQENIMKK